MDSRKIKQRVVDFQQFLNENELQEGIGSKIKSAFNRVGGWISELRQKIKDGLVRLIPSGPKKGLPIVAYFSQKDGSIVRQMKDYYSGTEFAKMDPTVESYNSGFGDSLEEARFPLESPDSSIPNVDSEELQELVESYYRSHVRNIGGKKKREPLFVFGAPGIGKTEIIGQAADSLGVDVMNLDLQYFMPEDFMGIPSKVDVKKPTYDDQGNLIDAGSGLTRSNPTDLLPRDNGPDGKGGIIFMDEMNRADKSVLRAIMQFIQMGRIGPYQLPDKWVLIAAGNRPGEADVAELDAPLADRFEIVNYVPSFEKWKEYEETKGSNSKEIISFLNQPENRDLFHYLDPDKGELKYPTPRNWSKVSRGIMDAIEDKGVESWRDLPERTLSLIFERTLGSSAASKVMEYFRVIKEIPEEELRRMITDPDNAMIPRKVNVSILYGLSGMLIGKVIEMEGKEPPVEFLFNIMKYMKRMGKENFEVLAWVYKRIIEKFPYFNVTPEVLNNPEVPENQIIKKAAEMIRSASAEKGLT